MKKIGILISIILISMVFLLQSSFLFSENNKTPNTTKLNKVDKGGGFVSNKRFNVKNVSFMPRFDYSGKGQVLEVIFDINNETEEPIELEYSVLAVYETTRVEPKERKWLPYPKWRETDFDKNIKIIKFAVSSPINQSTDDVWKNLLDSIENSKFFTASEKISEKTYLMEEYKNLGYNPPFWAYVNNITSNHTKLTHKFTLSGITGVKGNKKEQVSSNKKDGIEIDKGKYVAGLIEHSRLKATIFSMHKSQYRPHYYFFNKVLILILDPATGQVLYRRFYKFSQRVKIR